jgi:NADPH:quinone reductase-like Zn-dependent oxidoreductase
LIQREILGEGTVQLRSPTCQFRYERLKPGVLRMTIDGDDRGDFGSATYDEVSAEFSRFNLPLALFIDATAAMAPPTKVMDEWTAWFMGHRQQLKTVAVLVDAASKVTHLSVSIAKHLSHTGDLITIFTERDRFERVLLQHVAETAIATR